jgi:hypothetical protein
MPGCPGKRSQFEGPVQRDILVPVQRDILVPKAHLEHSHFGGIYVLVRVSHHMSAVAVPSVPGNWKQVVLRGKRLNCRFDVMSIFCITTLKAFSEETISRENCRDHVL